jgi:hypothetical protein
MGMFSKLKTQIIRESVKSKIPANLSEIETELIFGRILESAPFKGSDGAWYIHTDGGHVVKLDRDYFDDAKPQLTPAQKKILKARKRGDLSYPFVVADSDGTVETLEGPEPYKKGDYIMTGVAGEKWPIRAEKFPKKYRVDQANPAVAFPNPDDAVREVEIADAEGEIDAYGGAVKHKVKPGDYIVTYGPGDRARVQKDVFEKTYEVLPEEEGK